MVNNVYYNDASYSEFCIARDEALAQHWLTVGAVTEILLHSIDC